MDQKKLFELSDNSSSYRSSSYRIYRSGVYTGPFYNLHLHRASTKFSSGIALLFYSRSCPKGLDEPGAEQYYDICVMTILSSVVVAIPGGFFPICIYRGAVVVCEIHHVIPIV